MDQLEEQSFNAVGVDHDIVITSIAISLKRIADVLEESFNKDEVQRRHTELGEFLFNAGVEARRPM